ncbi:MAG: glucose 1-dehydrogenase [Hyphomonadaceae bacterium]|nr:glucose 1-dehydrogenase [Hyphomonadaceae bacterium]
MTGSVEGKVAIVTGAASSHGIGHAIARLLVKEGASVVVTDIDRETGRAAAAEIGAHAVFMEHDVTSEADWRRVIGVTMERWGRLAILVNNAGVTGGGQSDDIETLRLEAWRAVQAVNVEGVLLGCKHAIAVMRQGGGSIVNISSMAALVATPTLPAYGASKAAVRQISQTVALHCARRDYPIRCNSVHPGFIETEILSGAFPESELERIRKSVPIGRLGAPDDVAQAVLYLASDASRYVTGTRLIVDGGSTMQ